MFGLFKQWLGIGAQAPTHADPFIGASTELSDAPEINPASGLPMMDTALDVAGNVYGESHDPCGSDFFNDFDAGGGGCGSWDD